MDHPAGGHGYQAAVQWLRIGMDFRLKCEGCGHELMLPRSKAEKAIKKILNEEDAR